MVLNSKSRASVLTYLTQPVKPCIDDKTGVERVTGLTSPAELARKLSITEGEAAEIENDQVVAGLVLKTPGWWRTPRYQITEAGLVFSALADARGRALTREKLHSVLVAGDATPYAGDVISLTITLGRLVELELVDSADGGATFFVEA